VGPTTDAGRRGAVLIVVLIVLSALSLLAFGISYRTRLEMHLAQFQFERAYARELAEAAVVIAMEKLRQDDNDTDYLAEAWHTDLTLEAEQWPQEEGLRSIGSQSVECSCLDEEGKINVNTAGPDVLEKLLEDNRELCAGILDWLDSDDNPRPGGGESSYYQALSPSYSAKNKALQILPELLLVKGVGRALYCGEDANRNRVLDLNENDGTVTLPLDNADGRLQLGLRDLLTTYGDGRINLNTAPLEVLKALPGLSDSAARAIVLYRDGFDRAPGTDDDHPFGGLNELSEVPGLTEFEIDVLKHFCTLSSQHFCIISTASIREGKVRCCVEVVVRRTEGEVVPILRREEP